MHVEELSILLLSIGLLLAFARALGELARRLRQPAVVGELFAGILLGPTVFGNFAPELSSTIFPVVGQVALVRNSLATVGAALFLLIAGMEVNLKVVWRQGRSAISVSLLGLIVPFGLGFAAASVAPELMGHESTTGRTVFTLFLATAMAISALPVIARTLLDLNMLRSDFGMIILTAATVDDLAGWMIFVALLNSMGDSQHHIAVTILLTFLFLFAMLVALRLANRRIVPWLQAYTTYPRGVLAFTLVLAFLGAAFTEWIGIHAVFGAYVVGIAIGDSRHFGKRLRFTVNEFVLAVFAPLFFANIGLSLNFYAHFDWALTAFILILASAGKVGGCALGAWLGKLPAREAWAIGCGMNARGAMEIILGLLALEAGLIGERLFVALVVMALVTSMLSGPLMQAVLRRREPRRLADHVAPTAFVRDLNTKDPREAIRKLAGALASAAGMHAAAIDQAAWAREQLMSTALGQSVAAPHARIEGVTRPVVAVGFSEQGVSFDSPDGKLTKIVFLVVTPQHDDSAQLELLSDIARLFGDGRLIAKIKEAGTATEFIALLRSVQQTSEAQ